MRVFHHYSEIIPKLKGGVVALGNFDGVHLGHQAVIGAAEAIAHERKIPCGVMTFEPHPRLLFKPEADTFRLTPPAVKARLIERLGVDYMVLQDFNREFAALTADEFVARVLLGGLGIRHVVIGYDYQFGAKRSGSAETLRAAGLKEGFGVTCVGPISAEDGNVYSSTRMREALRHGRLKEASAILGRSWEIEGLVEKGDQRGRLLGFPTANIRLDDYMHPAFGVYAVRVTLGEGEDARCFGGVANIGLRPTFDKKDALIETHLFDFSGDLYGKTLRVSFVEFLRSEQKFDGVETLQEQIAADCQAARAILAVGS